MSEPISRARILVVDDDPIVLAVIAAKLRRLGHIVVTADDGADAVRQLTGDEIVDLVVTDLTMPEVGGLDILRHVRDLGLTAPVIVLSAHTDMASVLDAVRQGAFDYVLKDHEHAPLAAAVTRALNQVRLVRENGALLAELRSVNQQLEHQVAVRTSQLQRSNDQLRSEHARLECTVRELQDAQARLIQAEKIASVGMLTAGVAHEINNPLSFVIPNVEFVQDAITDLAATGWATPAGQPDLAELLDMLSDCSYGLDRIRTIVRQLKVFARQEAPEPTPVCIDTVFESLLTFTRAELRHHAEIVCDIAPECWVRVCVDQLNQVLLNLLVNSAHAIPPDRSGIIQIRAFRRDSDVVIEVADNGVGISEDHRERVFEPFFTTRRQTQGTGLGLSISLGLTRKMGGDLTVQSTVGEGTTMTVRLPAWDDDDASMPSSNRAAPAAPTPAKSILILDDEAATLRALSRVLGRLHAPVGFTTGTAALEWLDAHPPPDIILCDLMMPEMSGPQFFRLLTERAPALARRVVFVTGGAVTREARHFVETVDNPVVLKPLSEAVIHSLPELLGTSMSPQQPRAEPRSQL